MEVMPEATGILTYVYCENNAGLNFYILCSAKNDNGKIIKGPMVDKDLSRLRFSQIEDMKYLKEEDIELDFKELNKILAKIDITFDKVDDRVKALRNWTMLDGSRNIEWPDYVSVMLNKEGLMPELVWVKCTGYEDNIIIGELSGSTRQNFGIKDGQEIKFSAYDADGDIMLIAGI